MNPGREAKRLLRAPEAKKAEARKIWGSEPIEKAISHAARAAKEALLGQECLTALYGPKATLISALQPLSISLAGLLLTGAAAVGTVWLFNTGTWDLKDWQKYVIGLGIPLTVMFAKAAVSGVNLGDVANLKPLSQKANADQRVSLLMVFIAALVFGLLKSIPFIPDFVTTVALCLMECSLGLCASSYLLSFWVHSKGPVHFIVGRWHERRARDFERLVRVLDDGPGPNGPSDGASVRSFPSGAFSLVLATALAIASATNALAQFVPVNVYADLTPSVFSPERLDGLAYVGPEVARSVGPCEAEVTVSLYAWDGTGLSSRVPFRRFVFDSLSVPPCNSPFKLRCEYLRQQAKKKLARTRADSLTALSKAIVGLGALFVKPTGESCIWGFLRDADEAPGTSIVFTDAAVEGCGVQKPVHARPGSRLLVVVLARAGDGDRAQELVAARIAILHSLGFNAIDIHALRALHFQVVAQ